MVNINMTHIFKHPKYYKELRKRNKAARIPPTSSGQAASDQAISDEASTEVTSVRPGPGLKVSSSKPQASSSKRLEPRVASVKPQATSFKRQAVSYKRIDT